jgi:hypothetical protein
MEALTYSEDKLLVQHLTDDFEMVNGHGPVRCR